MTLIEKFNNLNANTVKRKHIESILLQAKEENEVNIVYRLSRLLNQYPDYFSRMMTLKHLRNNAVNDSTKRKEKAYEKHLQRLQNRLLESSQK